MRFKTEENNASEHGMGLRGARSRTCNERASRNSIFIFRLICVALPMCFVAHLLQGTHLIQRRQISIIKKTSLGYLSDSSAIPSEIRTADLEVNKYNVRNYLAKQFIRGYGIEIGAKSSPQTLPVGVHAINVDHLSTEDLVDKYKGNKTVNKKWVEGILRNPVHRIDDASTLGTFEDESLDFVIANHVLEHVQNFLGTLFTFSRKLRVGGIVFCAIPDRRYTEDYERPTTNPRLFVEELENSHLSKMRFVRKLAEAIYYSGPASTRDYHTAIKKASREVAENTFHGHHVHTFTTDSLLETFSTISRLKTNPFQLLVVHQVHNENILVLRKLLPNGDRLCFVSSLKGLVNGCPKSVSKGNSTTV